MSEQVSITFCHENAILPTRGSVGAAGYDLTLVETIEIPAGGRCLASTGIRVKIPNTLYGRVAPRSGLAVRHGINVGAGVIDSDYRGEVKVLLLNHGTTNCKLESGIRIAQLVFEKISHPTITFESADEFDRQDLTTRGTDGFGSTG